MKRIQALEFELIAELGDHVAPGRAVAPHGHRGFALRLAAEVELAQVDQRLVHRDVVDHAHCGLGIGAAHALQRGKHLRDDFEALGQDDVGRVEFAAIGVQHAHPAELVVQLEDLLLELDRVDAGQEGMHVHGAGSLGVRMPKADGQLEIRLRMTFLEEGPLTQDETVGVEFEVRRVVKDHFADVRFVLFGFLQVRAEAFRHVMEMLVELVEAVLIREALGLQQQLIFAVMDLLRHLHHTRLAVMLLRSVAHLRGSSPSNGSVESPEFYTMRRGQSAPQLRPREASATASGKPSEYQYDYASSIAVAGATFSEPSHSPAAVLYRASTQGTSP